MVFISVVHVEIYFSLYTIVPLLVVKKVTCAGIAFLD